jgi:hypothetical protein
MRQDYEHWLEQQKYESGTIAAQMHRAGRVEKHYGDLDEHYNRDRLESVISALKYTSDDRRSGRPNLLKIPFDGDVFNNLASYRNSVQRYRKFRDEIGGGTLQSAPVGDFANVKMNLEEEGGQRVGLERDMQVALRKELGQLGPGLVVIDGGAERSVESGLIDITAKDESGVIVVIELKAGAAGQRAVAQILSYMGDVAAEDENSKVRGILVAAEFDGKARSAARMVPNLALRRYRVRFEFSDGGT